MFGIKKHAGGFDCSDRKLIAQDVVTPTNLNLATGRDKIFVPGLYKQ